MEGLKKVGDFFKRRLSGDRSPSRSPRTEVKTKNAAAQTNKPESTNETPLKQASFSFPPLSSENVEVPQKPVIVVSLGLNDVIVPSKQTLENMGAGDIYQKLCVSGEAMARALATIIPTLPLEEPTTRPVSALSEPQEKVTDFVTAYDEASTLYDFIPMVDKVEEANKTIKQVKNIIAQGFAQNKTKPIKDAVEAINNMLTEAFNPKVGKACQNAAEEHLGRLIKGLCTGEKIKFYESRITENADGKFSLPVANAELTEAHTDLTYSGVAESLQLISEKLISALAAPPGAPETSVFLCITTYLPPKTAQRIVEESGTLPHLLTKGQKVSKKDIGKAVITIKAPKTKSRFHMRQDPVAQHAGLNAYDTENAKFIHVSAAGRVSQEYASHIKEDHNNLKATFINIKPGDMETAETEVIKKLKEMQATISQLETPE